MFAYVERLIVKQTLCPDNKQRVPAIPPAASKCLFVPLYYGCTDRMRLLLHKHQLSLYYIYAQTAKHRVNIFFNTIKNLR